MALDQLRSDALDQYGRGYPSPQLRRATWFSLNGAWHLALDPRALWRRPEQVTWNARITVPFSPETQGSGIANTSFYQACWYRRHLERPPLNADQRLMLRFGAVDYEATVWVNGVWVGEHSGGYTPFSFDITEASEGMAGIEVVVRAFDDPQDLAKPRGKQDWQLEPHSIWYPRTTGIWQTVWLELVPTTSLQRIVFTPHLTRWEIGFEAWVGGEPRDPLRISVTLTSRDSVLASDTYTVIAGEVHRRIALSDPGIDDSRNELLWSPDAPNLVRFVLNNRPYLLRMVLDQGYWPETGLTAPDDQALRRDVSLAKEMGFNGVRKHQKIEDPRYLYWADRLGLAVWEEMSSAYRFTPRSVERLTREWADVIARDISHPCIVSWVPINESWGVPNLPDNPRERHYVQALYHLTRTLDSTRPVIGNDGWESVATDIIGIHDYDDRPDRMRKRYLADEVLPRLFKRQRPGGRILVLEGQTHSEQPLMLTEFGGIAFSRDESHSWGYARARSAEEFELAHRELLDVVRNLQVLSGFCTRSSPTHTRKPTDCCSLTGRRRSRSTRSRGRLPGGSRCGRTASNSCHRSRNADRRCNQRRLTKPDGRALLLYARQPIPEGIDAPSPRGAQARTPNAHLRWHPLRGEWVAYATHRQHRTFLPPPEYNPLAVTIDPAHPTEVPAGPWDVAVFENLFPTLTVAAHDSPDLSVPTEPGKGVCEVVVFTQDASASLGRLPLSHLELLIEVWADRYSELGSLPQVKYVFPFENRGVEVGVTLHHPHGQIYAYPFVPPVPARELEQQAAYYERHRRGLVEDFVQQEVQDEVRMLYDGIEAAAFMPVCARYSYEVWVAPKRAAPSFAALTASERADFAGRSRRC
ncbi:hypothetical protein BH18ACI5_BH18ACI5_29520 [soil metagenome]